MYREKGSGCFIIAAVSCIAVIAAIFFGYLYNNHRDYQFVTEPFLPVFDEINAGMDSAFELKGAGYTAGNMYSYSLGYKGDEDNFVSGCAEFCGSFSDKCEAEENRLADEDCDFSFSSGERLLECIAWNDGEVTVNIDFWCDLREIGGFSGISKLFVDTKGFTEEQISQLEAEKDGYPFEIYSE